MHPQLTKMWNKKKISLNAYSISQLTFGPMYFATRGKTNTIVEK